MVIILFSLLGVAALNVLIVFIVKTKPQKSEEEPQEIPADCCGAHAVCERDNLLSTTSQIIYFDDEELDVLTGKMPNSFSTEEMTMLENVFYTLKEQDVAGWLGSLQLRNIQLPNNLRDEALLIVSERRAKTTSI